MAPAKKYGPLASESVEREMDKLKHGTLKSSSGEKVTNPKQAIAIGLSEARRAGGKVPPPPGSAAKKRVAAKKSSAKKTPGGKASAKKSAPAKKVASRTES